MDAAANADYARGLARAFAGALFFSFPLLMTMEMWRLGVVIGRPQLALFLALSVPLLYGLSYYAGFRKTFGFRDDALDALAALAVGFVTSAALLALFGIIGPGVAFADGVDKVSLQAAPAAIGAMLARRQLSGAGDDDEDEQEENRRAGYVSELFLMAVGALFVALNVAPTEEMILIAYKMSAWHSLGLALLSLGLLHAIVYAVGFAGQEAHDGPWRAFVHFTLPGYAIALLVSLYALWTFGRTDGLPPAHLVSVVLVLGFPGALGAAAARLLV